MQIQIKKHCRILPGEALIDGLACLESSPVSAGTLPFLTEIYLRREIHYRKFFKMDTLAKLGFLAAEMLMDGFDRNEPKPDTGIILFNRSASFETDTAYQQTIQQAADYYPSPGVFVHTLPNIVAGEIAIRHRIHGETAFYVFRRFESRTITGIIHSTMASAGLRHALAGWIETCPVGFGAFMMLCEAGTRGGETLSAGNVERFYHLNEKK
jgi:hypothetical protein